MTFKNIIGQEKTKQILRGMANGERMPHALLLLAPPGVGGLPLGMAYAQYVLCENKLADDACGVCNACIKAEKMIHPDIHFSYPTIGSKTVATTVLKTWREAINQNPYQNINQWLEHLEAENKQGNIPVAECIEIVKKLKLKVFEASHKILIMWLPEYLGKEGNRLLKLIEEPPSQTLFLLIAENQDLILNTILSRCQLVTVPPLSDADIKEGLMQLNRSDIPALAHIKIQLSESKAAAIAQFSEGNFNDALSAAQTSENDNAPLFLEWLRTCFKGNGVELVKWIETFAVIGREKQKLFLKYGLHFIRELMVLTTTGNENLRLQGEELKAALKMKNIINFDKIDMMAQLFDQSSYFIERNANPKILFLDASIKMHKILRG